MKDGITDWIKNWKINNWKSANKKPVRNKDLWIKLDNSCRKHKVSWKWVKAHAGNKFNNLVDELAVFGDKKINYKAFKKFSAADISQMAVSFSSLITLNFLILY